MCDPAADLSALPHVEARVFTPRALGEPLPNLTYLFLGNCQVGHLAAPAASLGCEIEHIVYDSSFGSQLPTLDLARFDAVVVSLTLRTLINEAAGVSGDLAHVRDTWSPDAAAETFAQSVGLMTEQLRRLNDWSCAPTFIFTFLEPSFSYLGQLRPASSIDDFGVFVRRLNEELVKASEDYPNLHIFDLNEAFNMVGRLHLQSDGVAPSVHSAIIGTLDDSLDGERLTPIVSNHDIYDVATALPVIQSYVFRSLTDAVKILRGTDRVKLIIVDLDDTLWRGVAADSEVEGWARMEGWPLGFAEALLYFKKRGGLLAICSKNDHDATVERFAEIWSDRLLISDFVSVKINWRPKSENIRTILQEVNISADQALFIDDNPREIDEVQASLPTLRCLGGRVGSNPRDWRRIILRSPETQVSTQSQESQRRTELVRASIERETMAVSMDRMAWLQSLDLHAALHLIGDTRAPTFARAFELINKTNQFNTTGQRWSTAEMELFFKSGGQCLAISLKDKTVDNGLIGAALVKAGEIVQVVLSCRVFGLGAETVLGVAAMRLALQATDSVRATIVNTGKNLSCQNYFDDLGFEKTAEGYIGKAPPEPPSWIEIEASRRFLEVS
ncbi:MAG: HAD-IIIC family phosphatase [Caulobacteraceae bacterium]